MGDVHGKLSNGIISIEKEGKEVVTLDKEGRVLYYGDGTGTWKRSLANRYILIGWDEQKRIIEKLSAEESDQISRRAYDFLREIAGEIEDSALSSEVEAILGKSEGWQAEDGKSFDEIYSGLLPVIPQDQRFSVYFQLISGSGWNSCTFATPGEKNVQRDDGQFLDHIRSVKAQFGKGMELRRGAFVGDVSVLNSDQKPLLRAMDMIRDETGLPLYAFVEAFSVPKSKNMIHFQDMKRHGLSKVYVGIQSGSVSLLRHFERLKNVSEILNLVNNLKNSGIAVGLVLLTGYGGPEHSEEHVNETAAIISQMDLDEGDIIYISPMDEKDDPRYAKLVEDGTFSVMSPEEKQKQADLLEKRIREEFRGSNRTELRTQISRYDIREGIY